MDHFGIRCEERVGRQLDRRKVIARIESGKYEMLASCGGCEEYAVPVGRAAYKVVYDRRSGRLVTIYGLKPPACASKRRRSRGKRRQTKAKKLVPLRSYGRMA